MHNMLIHTESYYSTDTMDKAIPWYCLKKKTQRKKKSRKMRRGGNFMYKKIPISMWVYFTIHNILQKQQQIHIGA